MVPATIFATDEAAPVRFLNATTAIVQAEWQNPAAPPPSTAVDDMIVTFVLVRNGGRWLATQVDLHNVSAPPIHHVHYERSMSRVQEH